MEIDGTEIVPIGVAYNTPNPDNRQLYVAMRNLWRLGYEHAIKIPLGAMKLRRAQKNIHQIANRQGYIVQTRLSDCGQFLFVFKRPPTRAVTGDFEVVEKAAVRL